MKKVVLALSLAGVLGATNIFAQQPPIPADLQSEVSGFKNFLVYGDLGFNSQNNNNTSNGTDGKFTNFSINPGLGYRLNQHFMVGLQGGVDYTKTNVSYSGTTISDQNKTDNWTIGAFIRHSYDISRTFFCFSQLNVAYMNLDAYPNSNFVVSSYNNSTLDQITNGYGFQAYLYPGIGINLPNSYALTLNLGGIIYSSITQDHGNGTSSNFNINFAQGVKIGVQKEFNFRRTHSETAFREPGDEMHHRSMEKMDSDDDDNGSRKESRKVHDMDDE